MRLHFYDIIPQKMLSFIYLNPSTCSDTKFSLLHSFENDFYEKYIIQKVELSYESFYLFFRKELNARGGVFLEKHKEGRKKRCFNNLFKKGNNFLLESKVNLV